LATLLRPAGVCNTYSHGETQNQSLKQGSKHVLLNHSTTTNTEIKEYDMAIYMNYDKKRIKGNVTAEGYQETINVNSFSWGVGRGISMESGAIANREATRPSLSEITISKIMDNSTPGLFKESVSGDAGAEVVIEFVATGAKKIETYMKYTLTNCLVSSYSVSADAEGKPVESLSLSYTKVLMDYCAADATNKSGSSNKLGYDLTKGAPC